MSNAIINQLMTLTVELRSTLLPLYSSVNIWGSNPFFAQAVSWTLMDSAHFTNVG